MKGLCSLIFFISKIVQSDFLDDKSVYFLSSQQASQAITVFTKQTFNNYSFQIVLPFRHGTQIGADMASFLYCHNPNSTQSSLKNLSIGHNLNHNRASNQDCLHTD